MNKSIRLKYFPMSFFSMILGLAGFTIAFQKVEEILGFPYELSPYVLLTTIFVFAALSIVYLAKIIKYPDEVKKEWNHPIKINFFPIFSISFLLLSVALLGINMVYSKYLWMIGSSLHLIITLAIISIWIQHSKFKIEHMNPSWFIPAVGNIIIPVAGVAHFSPEISWFFFSIGIMFWIVLLVIFFNRIFFHEFLQEKLLPTLFILIAPPAVGFIAYVKLTGEISEFANIMYYFALFLTLLLFFQFKMFYKIKFYLSWWAYSFPISAMTIATILMFHETENEFFKIIAYGLFALLIGIVILLSIRTSQAMFKGEVCVEED